MINVKREVIKDDIANILGSKTCKLDGFILSTLQLSDLVKKLIMSMGIPSDSFRVFVGADNRKNFDGKNKNREMRLYVCAEIRKDALRPKKKSNNTGNPMMDFIMSSGETTGNKNKIDPAIVKEMKYKFYTENLTYDIRDNKFRLIFDPEVLISYIFNIDYTAKEFIVKACPVFRKDVEKQKSYKKQISKQGLRDCSIIIIFPENNKGYSEEALKAYDRTLKNNNDDE